MNNKMNKTGKPKASSSLSSLHALEFMVGNNIKSAWARKGRGGGGNLLVLIYLAQQNHWVTYLKITGRWTLRAKKCFFSRPTCMEVIHEHYYCWCADSCREKCWNCASAVLQDNNIYPPYFSTPVLIVSSWNR